MIKPEEFLKIVSSRQISIPAGEAQEFYDRLPRLYVLTLAAQIAKEKLLALTERNLLIEINNLNKERLPFLQKISDPKLDIFKGADPNLLQKFFTSIQDDLQLQDCRIGRKEIREILHLTMSRRLKMYRHIFEITDEDMQNFRAEADKKVIEKEHQRKTKVAVTGAIVVTATLAAGAALWSLFTTDKADSKEEKKK